MILAKQFEFALPPGRGGRRRGAGRKPVGARPRVPHVRRPSASPRHPAHVTLRAGPGVTSLRVGRVFTAVREAIARAQRGRVFRICHFSIQSNHIHMIVEAKDRQTLSRGVQGLAIRVARAINRVLGRRGEVWSDRYHRHDLATPREVRHALVYVLQNVKKHQPGFAGLDPCSSARWFAGWASRPPTGLPRQVRVPVVDAETWLLASGWRRYGLIEVHEAPRG